MPFEKGKPRPAKAGRKKGTPNKLTSVRQLIDEALARNEKSVNKLLDEMCKEKADLKYLLDLKFSCEPKPSPGSLPLGASFMAEITPVDIDDKIKNIVAGTLK